MPQFLGIIMLPVTPVAFRTCVPVCPFTLSCENHMTCEPHGNDINDILLGWRIFRMNYQMLARHIILWCILDMYECMLKFLRSLDDEMWCYINITEIAQNSVSICRISTLPPALKTL